MAAIQERFEEKWRVKLIIIIDGQLMMNLIMKIHLIKSVSIKMMTIKLIDHHHRMIIQVHHRHHQRHHRQQNSMIVL